MNSASNQELAHDLLDAALADIPLTQAMGIRLGDYAGDRLRLLAPLAPNVNDKGCAFGGSLASLLTLAGWGLIALKLKAAGHDCDIYVQDSTIRYLAPVWSDLAAHAELAEGESWDTFFAALTARGRARVRVMCRTPLAAGNDACTLDARFVAMLRKPETSKAE
jgi:thioesterase domain-containing protein